MARRLKYSPTSYVDSQTWRYEFDNLGNRLALWRGPATQTPAEEAGRLTAYQPNVLNQYEGDPTDNDPPAIAHPVKTEITG
jgi:hypothetical protein